MYYSFINEGQRAIRYRNGKAQAYLRPGRHWTWRPGQYRVELLNAEAGALGVKASAEWLKLVPAEDAQLVTVPQGQVGLMRDGDRPSAVLRAGRWLVWHTAEGRKVELVELEGFRTAIPLEFWSLAPSGLVSVVDVSAYERTLAYVDGVLEQILAPGRYGLNAWQRRLTFSKVDMRERELQVVGQEIMTFDKVSMRLNLLVKWRVVDPRLSVERVDNLSDALYAEAQLAARDALSKLRIDELLEGRAEVSRGLGKTVASRAQTWGVEIVRLDLKDLVLPGDMKALFNQVIEAEKRAAAQNVTRREEIAATRSQANTAKLLAQNPVLLRLKELESLKEMAEQVDNLTVNLGAEEINGALFVRDAGKR